ncbi:hypothetical protein [Streptomyces hoynatensis]|uniref:hypothetical protein n=1 Tax=Streptomyces hoynatensis TaxID=1141874 RepID=UPI001319BC48|nr:hypothetical protein [Streptomyces hoynatensis]
MSVALGPPASPPRATAQGLAFGGHSAGRALPRAAREAGAASARAGGEEEAEATS